MKNEKHPIEDILTSDERAALIAVPNSDKPSGLRNLCIMMLMLDAGLKISEIVGKEKQLSKTNKDLIVEGGLRLENIDLRNGKITVISKKRGTREVWINEKLKDYLKKWLAIRPGDSSDLVFVNLKGGKINNRYVREFLEKYRAKAGIRKKVHPNLLRHTFARDLYAKSHNIKIVQKTLGHSDIKQTLKYVDVDEKEIERAMKNFGKER